MLVGNSEGLALGSTDDVAMEGTILGSIETTSDGRIEAFGRDEIGDLDGARDGGIEATSDGRAEALELGEVGDVDGLAASSRDGDKDGESGIEEGGAEDGDVEGESEIVAWELPFIADGDVEGESEVVAWELPFIVSVVGASELRDDGVGLNVVVGLPEALLVVGLPEITLDGL